MPRARAAATRLTVTLPIPSGQLGPNGRVHWRKKHQLFQQAKAEAWVLLHRELLRQEMLRPLWRGAVQVDVLWVAKQQNHLPDADNALARLKHVFDAGQAVMLYENDRQVQIRSIRREVGRLARVELTFEAEESA